MDSILVHPFKIISTFNACVFGLRCPASYGQKSQYFKDLPANLVDDTIFVPRSALWARTRQKAVHSVWSLSSLSIGETGWLLTFIFQVTDELQSLHWLWISFGTFGGFGSVGFTRTRASHSILQWKSPSRDMNVPPYGLACTSCSTYMQ